MLTTIIRRCSTAFLIVVLSSDPLSSQSTATNADTGAARRAAAAEEQVSPASPRASLQRFLELARAAQYGEAATYLDLPDSLRTSGPTLARQLRAVLDRHVWFDLQEISPAATGDTADGLPARVEQIAEIRNGRAARQPVRLTKFQQDGETVWRFSRATVERIPAWYATLGDRWMLEHLPAVLLRPGPFDILLWQWAALPLLLAIATAFGLGVSRLLRSFFGRIARRTSTGWDDALLARLGGPLTVTITLAATAALLPGLGLYPPAAAASYRVLQASFLLVFFWSLWRLVDVGRQLAARTVWARTAASSRSLIPLGARVVKAVVIAFAAVTALSLLGYPVASLVAGLGLGGLAFALAAQKTVENLFGAFSIGVDQPFREGDFVKVGDFVGSVEAIGLRSTRFRTLDRTIITIPNGRLADMQVESFAVRDRLRFAMTAGLPYVTTTSQMREVLAGIEHALRAQPKLWPEGVTVRFREIGASSLVIEVMAWFQTINWEEFTAIRQDLLLQFMDVAERAGTGFGLPSSTVHIASLPAGTPITGSAGSGGSRQR